MTIATLQPMNKVIILLGPTGVGKTGASILLAKALDTEIISSDSMQIYRGMDIGTAKPSEEQRISVKHHMIDIISPSEPYSVGRYIEDVTLVIDELHRKGKIPIVVGGTGLYIKAMTRGIFSGPSADWKLREELASLEEGQGGALYSYLQELDPEAAAKIMPADTRRIIRALEVYLKTKKGISEFQQKLTTPLPHEFIKIGLKRERKELYRTLEERVDKMIDSGLVEEVRKLTSLVSNSKLSPRRVAEGDQTPNFELSCMQAIGYKEIAMYLNGEMPLEEAIRLIKRSTKRYAKRQFTWFRKEDDIHWIDIAGIQDVSKIFKRAWKILDGLINKT